MRYLMNVGDILVSLVGSPFVTFGVVLIAAAMTVAHLYDPNKPHNKYRR